MSFEERFNIINVYKNDYKSQKQIYKYFSTFEDEFSYSEVYTFFKEYINHLKNLFSNSCKTISLYAIQNNINHQIFYISTDAVGNTIKKEKFTEDINIIPPFNIYFQIETINIPIQFTTNTPKNVLRPTFKIKREYSPRTFDGSIEKRLYLYTTRIEHGDQTPEEIYNLCVPHLINFQCLYKKDRIEGEQITKSCYEISLTNKIYNKAIYYCEINTDGDTIEEVKIYERLNPRIQKPYKIQLTIYLILNPSQQQSMEYNTQLEIEELELRLINLKKELEAYQNKSRTTNKSTKEETCCICLSSPSNILFPDCAHICICKNCNNNLTKTSEEQIKCPLCRTLTTQPRLII